MLRCSGSTDQDRHQGKVFVSLRRWALKKKKQETTRLPGLLPEIRGDDSAKIAPFVSFEAEYLFDDQPREGKDASQGQKFGQRAKL